MLTPEELTGRTRSHVIQYETPRFAAHPDAGKAFLDMAALARKDGIILRPFSAFRDFDAQVGIWNLKFSGKRPLLNQFAQPIRFNQLNDDEKVFAILQWTALPGASRHHWGSEIDVVEGQALDQGYRAELIPAETEKGGVFYDLRCWLDEHMARFGFFRPYANERGGVNPEPWHISFNPVSEKALAGLTLDLLTETIDNSSLQGKNTILSQLPVIYSRFVKNITVSL